MISVSMFTNEPSKVILPAGSYLFREGDSPDVLYLLISGQARMLVGTREVEVFGPGRFVGEMSLIEKFSSFVLHPGSGRLRVCTD